MKYWISTLCDRSLFWIQEDQSDDSKYGHQAETNCANSVNTYLLYLHKYGTNIVANKIFFREISKNGNNTFYFIKKQQRKKHRVETSAFFCPSDFMWNQFHVISRFFSFFPARHVFIAVLNYIFEMLTWENMMTVPPDLTYKVPVESSYRGKQKS